MVVAMTSTFWKKRKNFNINRKGGIFKKKSLKAEDLPLYRKTLQVCYYRTLFCYTDSVG